MTHNLQPIVLVTDFGLHGPYIGQVLAVMQTLAPDVPTINLFANAPMQNPRATAYLLAAYAPYFAPGAVFFCVVDPGVGNWQHHPIILNLDDRWFVGPDNGLFHIVARRSNKAAAWPITWRPESISTSFHGRDLYAPITARLAVHALDLGEPAPYSGLSDWPDDLAEIIYIDHYGNAMTGLRAQNLSRAAVIEAHGHFLCRADTFSQIPRSQGCWYENSNGLVELAVNCGRADHDLGIMIGTKLNVLERQA